MFTGLVTAVGTVQSARAKDGGRVLAIRAPWRGLALGESIAVDGACLTVTGRRRGAFTVHVIATSLERTAFGDYRAGRRVNLERALRAGDRLGGHLVQGHVDGLGQVRRVAQQADALLMDLTVPASVADASIPLGSITVDGVSLTVNALRGRRTVQVSLIPFTLQHTTLGDRQIGDRVHLEGDTIGKYVAAWLSRRGKRA
ncbi:MAG: riboflavin synthase [Gemmatimonadales bacterium]|jgi:riboflavin synthase|nr:MAG: riboflavin synthase [Gemmatimonadales bacterium]